MKVAKPCIYRCNILIRFHFSNTHKMCTQIEYPWFACYIITTRKNSCVKAMFSQVSVSHSVRRGWGWGGGGNALYHVPSDRVAMSREWECPEGWVPTTTQRHQVVATLCTVAKRAVRILLEWVQGSGIIHHTALKQAVVTCVIPLHLDWCLRTLNTVNSNEALQAIPQYNPPQHHKCAV